MELKLHKDGKKTTGKMKVADAVFSAEFNEPLIHQVVTAYMAGARTGTKKQKNRAAVRGGGRKPFRQKGLGRARAGTIRSPIWRGGGVTFAAKNRDFSQKVNRKMYRGAMRSILSELIRQDRLVVIDDLAVADPKTKPFIEKLKAMKLDEVLIVTDEMSDNLFLASRNVPRVDVIDTDEINPFMLIGFEKVLMTKGALEKVEARLS
ncbi:MAG TPA: 50S ribosomal protein L4 [Gammaproteobacteria bacterium]|nr:50S ribosomal protein L4 [Gammaproteobacteria bacterium]